MNKLTPNEVLDDVKQAFGMVPNLMQGMSQSPAAVRAYLDTSSALARGAFSPLEQQALMLAISARNECHYCTAVHRTMLSADDAITDADIDAIDNLRAPSDDRLAALVEAAWLLMDREGWLTAADRRALDARGIGTAELYEIITVVSLKTISNWVNHLAETEIDAPFAPQASRSLKAAA